MRSPSMIALGLVLAACEVPADREPDGPGRDGSPPDLQSSGADAHALVLPAGYASSHAVVVYAERDGERVTERTELTYGLAEQFPRRIEVASDDGFVLDDGCRLAPGAVVWRSIVEVEGTAANLELGGGALRVELVEEGTVTAILDGEIAGQDCTFADGPLTTVPLRHTIVVKVQRVAGFVVEQFQQKLGDCHESVVLPADAPLWAPTAQPLDAADQPFAALNAPAPATITLRSDGALARADEAGQLWAGPGEVSVTVDTALPVRGLRSFTVVGPDALTSVDAALYLRKAAAKGSVVERIEDGGSYRLFFPELANGVDLHVDAAMTARGKLCANVPASWIAASSATPAQCAANVESAELTSAIPVATLGAAGECRLAVTIPGTPHEWRARFTTTR